MSSTPWYETSGKIKIYHDKKKAWIEAYGFAIDDKRRIKFMSKQGENILELELEGTKPSSSFPFWSSSSADATETFPYTLRSTCKTTTADEDQRIFRSRYSFSNGNDYRVFIETLRNRTDGSGCNYVFCGDYECEEVEPSEGNILYERSICPLIKIWKRVDNANEFSISFPLRLRSNAAYETLDLPYSHFNIAEPQSRSKLLSGYNGNITLNLIHQQQNARLTSIKINFKKQKDFEMLDKALNNPLKQFSPRLGQPDLGDSLIATQHEVVVTVPQRVSTDAHGIGHSPRSVDPIATNARTRSFPWRQRISIHDRSIGHSPRSVDSITTNHRTRSFPWPQRRPSSPVDSMIDLQPSHQPQNPSQTVSVNASDSTSGESQHMQQDKYSEQLAHYWKRQDEASTNIAATGRSVDNSRFYKHKLTSRDTFRVLTIMKGELRQDLHLRFKARKLNEFNPKDASRDSYEAVSYNWGIHDTTVNVIVNDQSGFKISQHLKEGLERLRLTESDRKVWIDAICINQMDIEEMNHQVNIMGRIYERAKRTVIWYSALGSTGLCQRNYPAQSDLDHANTLCTGGVQDHIKHSVMQQSLKQHLDHLQRSKSNSLWNWRLWCVQEFWFSYLDPTVCVGPHVINWELFADFFSEVTGHEDALKLFVDLREWKKDATKTKPTLHDICQMAGNMSVGNPRDRIFSLIHIGQADHSIYGFEAVYEKSIGEIYEDAVRIMITQSKTLDVIMDSRPDRSEYGESRQRNIMSSFIPDFTKLVERRITEGIPGYDSGVRELGFKVSLKLSPLNSLQPHLQRRRMLRIRGKMFGTVQHCTSLSTWITAKTIDTSPSGELIYNSFENPGRLVEYVYRELQLSIETNMQCHDLDSSPQIGRLILEYLLEERRHYKKEFKRCSDDASKPLDDVLTDYQQQDEVYVKKRLSQEQLSDELKFVSNHWKQRRSYISRPDNLQFDLIQMIKHKANEKPWKNIYRNDNGERLIAKELWQDMQTALEYENLFCYARKNDKKYYMFKEEYLCPMRRDILSCANEGDVRRLATQQSLGYDAMEPHSYSAKAREREFFAIEVESESSESSASNDKFIGLGPASMKPDDIVVVPYGASRPFILRPCHDPIGSYNFVGEAIVPTIMHGEWIRRNETKFPAVHFDLI